MIKKNLKLLAFLLLLAPLAKAQHGISLPFSTYYNENAWLSLGLQYNYINSSYRIGLKEGWAKMGITNVPENNNLYIKEFKSIQAQESHGMSVSIPVELRFTDNLSSTFQPTFVFINNSGINYQGVAQEKNSGAPNFESTFIEKEPILRKMRHVSSDLEGSNFNAFEFPFNIKFRSDEKILKNKHNRYRGYITAGARYTRWIGIVSEYKGWTAVEKEDRPQPFVLKPGYLSWEAGIGAEIFFTYFRMSPEIKFIQSMGNVMAPNHELAKGNAFMAPLDKVGIRNIQFSLIFQ